MSDVSASASVARTTLARALSELQGEDVPEELLLSAEPIAEAMSLLFEIEQRADEGPALVPTALEHVQRALALLQENDLETAAVDDALESVAQALGEVHALRRRLPSPSSGESGAGPSTPMQASEQPGTRPGAGEAPKTAPMLAEPPSAPAEPNLKMRPPPAFDGSKTALIEPAMARKLDVASAPATSDAEDGATVEAAVAAVPELDTPPLSIDTSLGAHSSNNFYRGLSGNDILRHGGLFVATYSPPAVGQRLVLRVLMPGGYEFRARGVVRWCRDAPKTASTAPYAPPGYGAQLLEVPPEGQRLIERYVRNRQPLLFDDL